MAVGSGVVLVVALCLLRDRARLHFWEQVRRLVLSPSSGALQTAQWRG